MFLISQIDKIFVSPYIQIWLFFRFVRIAIT